MVYDIAHLRKAALLQKRSRIVWHALSMDLTVLPAYTCVCPQTE